MPAQTRPSTPNPDPSPSSYVDPARAAQLYREAKVPQRHAGRTQLVGAPWLAALAQLSDRLGAGFLVALCGPRGTGKTQLAESVIRVASDRGTPSRYIHIMQFLMAVKGAYGNDAERSEAAVVSEFIRPALLVIDEIQERGDTPWENRLLSYMIDRRYNSGRDTLLIANLLPDSLINSLGDSIVSRMSETGGIIECTWPSYREKSNV